MRKCLKCGELQCCIVSGQGNYEDGRRYGIFVCILCGDKTKRVLHEGVSVRRINQPYRDWKRSKER